MYSKHVTFYSVTISFKTITFILERIFAARHSMRTSVLFVFFSALQFDWVHWVHWIKYVCVGTRSRKDKKKTESLALIRWRCCQEWKCVHIKANQHAKSICQHSKSVHRNFGSTSVTTHCSRSHESIIFVSCFSWISIGRVSQYSSELIVNTRFRFATCVDVIGLSQVHAPYTLFSSFDGPQT